MCGISLEGWIRCAEDGKLIDAIRKIAQNVVYRRTISTGGLLRHLNFSRIAAIPGIRSIR